jgi:hypothetical protein
MSVVPTIASVAVVACHSVQFTVRVQRKNAPRSDHLHDSNERWPRLIGVNASIMNISDSGEH